MRGWEGPQESWLPALLLLGLAWWRPVPSPTTLGRVSVSFHQSQASCGFCQAELPCGASGVYLWAYHLEQRFLVELSTVLGKFYSNVAPVSEELMFNFIERYL